MPWAVFGRAEARPGITNAIFSACTALPAHTERGPHVPEARCLGVMSRRDV